jgi:hypothetical protein
VCEKLHHCQVQTAEERIVAAGAPAQKEGVVGAAGVGDGGLQAAERQGEGDEDVGLGCGGGAAVQKAEGGLETGGAGLGAALALLDQALKWEGG